jgi:hypothetical protein
MKNLTPHLLLLVVSISVVHSAEPRVHVLTCVFENSEEGWVVNKWIFDGKEYPDSAESLNEIRKIDIPHGDVIRIRIPIKIKDSWGTAGVMQHKLIHHWFRQRHIIELYHGENRVEFAMIGWRTVEKHEDQNKAVIILNRLDIGSGEEARKTLLQQKWAPGTVIRVMVPYDTVGEMHPNPPELITESVNRWREEGAECLYTPDRTEPLDDSCFPGYKLRGNRP